VGCTVDFGGKYLGVYFHWLPVINIQDIHSNISLTCSFFLIMIWLLVFSIEDNLMDEVHLIIRAIKKSDFKELANLAFLFEEYIKTLNPDRINHSYMTEELFEKHLFVDFDGFILEHKQKAEGYLLFNFGFLTDPIAKTLVVIDIFVTEKLRSMGAGRKLMEKAKDKAKESGASLITTSVWDKNQKAKAFYQSLGASLEREEIIVWLPI
jgi:ribosomal protein S18 acetylase RimI-like enzyme